LQEENRQPSRGIPFEIFIVSEGLPVEEYSEDFLFQSCPLLKNEKICALKDLKSDLPNVDVPFPYGMLYNI
jgi:hypothetical protein